MSITSAMVEAGILSLAKNPVVISGSIAVGGVLTASLRAGYSATGWQWTSGGVDIAGQTGNTYTVQSSDSGLVIGCRAVGISCATDAGTVPPVVPIFSAGPALSGVPQVGIALTVTAGTLNTNGVTSSYDILRDGQVVATGSNPTYTPVLTDLQHYFSARHHAVNSSGSDDAASAPQQCVPQTGAALAFATLPYCYDYRPVVGCPVLFSPATAQGTSVTITYQILWNGVLQGSAASTPPVYTPSATGSLAMRTTISNGSGTLTYDTAALNVIAAPVASGVPRYVSAHNKINFYTMTVSTTVDRKIMCNDEHTIGSGAIKGFRVAFDNIRMPSNGSGAPILNGNPITLEDIYAVVFYNGVRQGTPQRVTWDAGATGKVAADGAVDLQSDYMTPSMFGLTAIPAGATINLQTRWDWPKNTNMPSVEQTSGPTKPAQVFVYDPTTATITAGLGSTASQGGYILVGGTGTQNTQTGPKMRIIGDFVAGDPKVVFGFGDSTFGPGNATTNGVFQGAVNICVGKPPLAALNFQRFGAGSTEYDPGAVPGGAHQALVKYANIVLDGIHINTIGTGTATDSSVIRAQSLSYWATMKANAVPASGVIRPLKIVRNGLMLRLTTFTATNTLSSDQVSAPRISVGGDVVTDFEPWCQARVADGTIDAFNPIRDLFNLNSDPSKPNAFKAQRGHFIDGLHPPYGVFAGYKSRQVIDALP
ncbi:hypothetical protein FEE59_02955 [Herbaspirillum sp. RU 5E]|nr:hypothetical protein [Herbaspirillum sp. RU 5E]